MYRIGFTCEFPERPLEYVLVGVDKLFAEFRFHAQTPRHSGWPERAVALTLREPDDWRIVSRGQVLQYKLRIQHVRMWYESHDYRLDGYTEGDSVNSLCQLWEVNVASTRLGYAGGIGIETGVHGFLAEPYEGLDAIMAEELERFAIKMHREFGASLTEAQATIGGEDKVWFRFSATEWLTIAETDPMWRK